MLPLPRRCLIWGCPRPRVSDTLVEIKGKLSRTVLQRPRAASATWLCPGQGAGATPLVISGRLVVEHSGHDGHPRGLRVPERVDVLQQVERVDRGPVEDEYVPAGPAVRRRVVRRIGDVLAAGLGIGEAELG